jgi:hypothetical protein
MDPTRFDAVARRFAARRSRRAARAQEATTPPASGEKTMLLFVQSFRGGSIAPAERAEGRFALTLEQGLGQTVYFSDRPERIVGASPTPAFLAGLGFPDDNPPNAALVAETAAGTTEIAVVELYNPRYDEATHTATYDVAVLAAWEDSLGVGFTQVPADLAEFGDKFGAAHLFIDDCADEQISCYLKEGVNGNANPEYVGSLGTHYFCWNYSRCEPGDPNLGDCHSKGSPCQSFDYWRDRCSENFSQCAGGNCRPNTNSLWANGCG